MSLISVWTLILLQCKSVILWHKFKCVMEASRETLRQCNFYVIDSAFALKGLIG